MCVCLCVLEERVKQEGRERKEKMVGGRKVDKRGRGEGRGRGRGRGEG